MTLQGLILKVEKVAIFSGTFPSYGPPRDLKITLDRKKKINIYWFLAGEDSESGAIAEVEQLIATNLSKGPA